MKSNNKFIVKDIDVNYFVKESGDFISLTDIARYKNAEDPRFVIQNWMKTRYTVDFLGIWEQMYNSNFNRVEFDTFKNESGRNSFVLTPKKWIIKTHAIGIVSKSGRYDAGTFAHKDIAFEFASWISPEFKLFLIKEFQRLKAKESNSMKLEWDAKRFLVKANYKVHTDAVKENLLPKCISKHQQNFIYADEADVLNVSLFGMTAKEWKKQNPKLKGNIRDYADIIQLVCLAGLESLNAEFIRQEIAQSERIARLNQIAIIQMKSLMK